MSDSEYGFVDVSPELLVGMCTALTDDDRRCEISVSGDPLPKTAKIMRVTFTDSHNLRLVLTGTEPRVYRPTLTAHYEWRDVEIELPTEDGEYLICTENEESGEQYVTTVWFSRAWGEYSNYWHGDPKVTHWRPKPFPPKRYREAEPA